MEQLWSARSTNGRWGLAIVGPAGCLLPCCGTLHKLGTVSGIETWQVTPDANAGTWVVVMNAQVKVHGGASLVACQSLQSGSFASILLAGPNAVVERIGYKGRSRYVSALRHGEWVDIPAPVLLAMGLAQSSDPADAAPVVAPPPLDGAMAAAFAQLRG